MLRMSETPAIEVHIVKSSEAPGGIGETGTSAITAALTNAILCGDRQAHSQSFQCGSGGCHLKRLPLQRNRR